MMVRWSSLLDWSKSISHNSWNSWNSFWNIICFFWLCPEGRKVFLAFQYDLVNIWTGSQIWAQQYWKVLAKELAISNVVSMPYTPFLACEVSGLTLWRWVVFYLSMCSFNFMQIKRSCRVLRRRHCVASDKDLVPHIVFTPGCWSK